jgi:endonuclease-8
VAFSVHDAEWTSTDHLRRGAIGRLGPDLLAEAFDETEALRRLRARNADAIGLVLLDQRVVAGIGNVYKSEVLFLARVHPWTLVRDLDDGALSAVLAVGRRLLSANARPARGASLPAYGGERRTTGRDHPDAALWVYERQGAPCRVCGATIERALQGPDARGTWWCPRCQPPPTL